MNQINKLQAVDGQRLLYDRVFCFSCRGKAGMQSEWIADWTHHTTLSDLLAEKKEFLSLTGNIDII